MDILEFYTKDVFWGTIARCRTIGKNGGTAYKLRENCLFVKVGHQDYREVFDLNKADCVWYPKFKILNADMPHYATRPKNAGDFFIVDLKPFSNDYGKRKERIDIRRLAFIAANNKNEECSNAR